MVLKFDFVLVVACVVGVMFWIEREHRTYIGSPTAAEIATSRARAAGCADTDAAPYTASCLSFIEGNAEPDMRRQTDPYETDPSDAPN